MPELGWFGPVFDRLIEPIRKRPFRSVVFFSALLALGYYLLGRLEVRELYTEVLLALFFAIPLVGVVLSLHRLLVTPNDPSRLKNPGILEQVKNSFVGREEDAEYLTNCILNSRQLWLTGDSGVGKSSLLRKAILPKLKQQNIATAYLNSWRGDWESAPATALLAQLRPPNIDGDLFIRLSGALSNSSETVIFLDQFDEYQIEHLDRFVPERGTLITRERLEATNQFLSNLLAAVRDRNVRCVFVTRGDVELAKRLVLLDDANEEILRRLDKRVVEGEIARLIPSDAVENPENGWFALREQLCTDLAENGVLPIQMRFAVLGFDELRNDLNVSTYLRVGRIPGLVSCYIEHEIRRVAGDTALATELFNLLEHLVTEDGKATRSFTEDELMTLVPNNQRALVLQALEELERRDVVRRTITAEGAELWRLDHDYLAAPIREISRRQLPVQWELRQRMGSYRAASHWKKPLRLGGPSFLARLGYARLYKGLRFGDAASWFLFSLAAFLSVLSVFTYAAQEGYQWFVDEQLGTSLFSNFGTGKDTSGNEASALVQLAASSFTAKSKFLATGLESDENSIRLINHRFAVGIALTETRESVAKKLYKNVIRPRLANHYSGVDVARGSVALMSLWDTVESLNGPEVQQLTPMLIESISREKDSGAIFDVADMLRAPKDKVELSTIQRAVTTSVERMTREKNLMMRNSLAYTLFVLKDNVEPSTAQKLATTLVEQMRQEEDPTALGDLADVLDVFTDKVDPSTAQKLATTLVERMSQEKDADTLRSLAKGLGALNDKVDPSTAQKLATTLVERMSQEKDGRVVIGLAKGLGALKDKPKPSSIRQAVTTLVERISQEKNGQVVIALADELGALKDKVDPSTAQKFATTLVERMSRERDADTLGDLAEVLGAFTGKVDPSTAQKLAMTLVERMSQEKDAKALGGLAKGLGALKDKVDPSTAQRLATTLVERMSQEKSNLVLASLAYGLGALKDKVDPSTAQKLATTLVERMSQEKDADTLRSLANGLRKIGRGFLTAKDFSHISGAFEIPDAPCSVLLAFDHEVQQSQMRKQLRNPLCTNHDWEQLALFAANLAGRPIARKEGNLVSVDFPELSEYVWSDEPFYKRYEFSTSVIATLVLFTTTLCAFAGGLILSSRRFHSESCS